MKSISSFIVLLIAMLAGNVSEAQNFTLGVRTGLSIPNLTANAKESNPLNKGYKSRLGPDEAIFGDYHFSKLFSLEAMIQYSAQGGKKNGVQAFPTPPEMAGMFPSGAPQYLYGDYKSEAKLNYLLIPVLAKFGWPLGKSSPIRVYVDAGPFAGFLINAHHITNGNSDIYLDEGGNQKISPAPQSFDANENIKDQLNTFNFGVSGNVGLAYHFNKSHLFVEGGGNYGFLNIQQGSANGKNHTGAGTVGIGYGYTF